MIHGLVSQQQIFQTHSEQLSNPNFPSFHFHELTSPHIVQSASCYALSTMTTYYPGLAAVVVCLSNSLLPLVD